MTSAEEVVESIRRAGSPAGLAGMTRFGIPTDRAFGVPIGVLQKISKPLGRDHALAEALWKTGWYEARTVAAFVDEPERVTSAQMDRWSGEFDNWAICDTVCFHLFDRTPHAFGKVKKWSKREEEFPRRGAFALLWGLSVHDKASGDAPFLEGLALIERAATDDRHYVKKGVNMALRAVGKRNAVLHRAAMEVAGRLAGSGDATARWVGKDALRELRRAVSRRRFEEKSL